MAVNLRVPNITGNQWQANTCISEKSQLPGTCKYTFERQEQRGVRNKYKKPHSSLTVQSMALFWMVYRLWECSMLWTTFFAPRLIIKRTIIRSDRRCHISCVPRLTIALIKEAITIGRVCDFEKLSRSLESSLSPPVRVMIGLLFLSGSVTHFP